VGRVAWILCALAGCSFEPGRFRIDAAASEGDADSAGASDTGSADSTPSNPPQNLHLRVEALIDGESHLIIKGTTVHWRHYIYAAPGRWNFQILPIKLNGVDWYPTWPDVPDSENRSCNGCLSSTTQIPIGVPTVPSTATWTEVQTRRAQGIVQQPSAENDWELVVLISDYMVGGSADYIVDIDVTID
jgi:hypothetical protein